MSTKMSLVPQLKLTFNNYIDIVVYVHYIDLNYTFAASPLPFISVNGPYFFCHANKLFATSYNGV
jgi:hypothetical protein